MIVPSRSSHALNRSRPFGSVEILAPNGRRRRQTETHRSRKALGHCCSSRIPKGFRPSAQGCLRKSEAPQTTLGRRDKTESTSKRLWLVPSLPKIFLVPSNRCFFRNKRSSSWKLI